jgi:hypothetical protein
LGCALTRVLATPNIHITSSSMKTSSRTSATSSMTKGINTNANAPSSPSCDTFHLLRSC